MPFAHSLMGFELCIESFFFMLCQVPQGHMPLHTILNLLVFGWFIHTLLSQKPQFIVFSSLPSFYFLCPYDLPLNHHDCEGCSVWQAFWLNGFLFRPASSSSHSHANIRTARSDLNNGILGIVRKEDCWWSTHSGSLQRHWNPWIPAICPFPKPRLYICISSWQWLIPEFKKCDLINI